MYALRLPFLGKRRKRLGGKNIIKELFERDGDRCHYCKRKTYLSSKGLLPEASADHYVPLAKGGKDNIENLVVACKACNNAKGNKMPNEFIADRTQ